MGLFGNRAPARAAFGRTAARQHLDGIVAAATIIDPADKKQVESITKRPLPWQKQAYDLYESLGEVSYAANWTGDALSKLRIIPAYMERPGAQPVPIENADGIDAAVIDAANAAVARLDSGAEGGTAELMRALGINDFLCGEEYLVGRVVDQVESWEVHSVEALVRNDRGNLAIMPDPGASPADCPTLDEANDLVVQIMRRSSRYRGLPYSPMRAALPYCEDLSLLTQMVRAVIWSRIPAGILVVPDTASWGGTVDDTADDQDGEAQDDPFIASLIEHFTTPKKDPSSAAALVPYLLTLDPEDAAAIKKIDFGRDLDQLAIQLREEARRAFAGAVDLPGDLLLGKADLNHWTAWQIPQEAYDLHIKPRAVTLLDAVTMGYYRPALDAAGVEEVGQHCLGVDASDLVAKPDVAAHAQEAYDRGEASGEYLREATGVPESAKPDDAELARRERIKVIVGKPAGTGPSGTDTNPGPPAGSASTTVVLASAVQQLSSNVGVQLARAEQQLRERLRVAADSEMRRALERAGNRLRNATQGDRKGLAAQAVRGVPASEVAATLGRTLVAALDVTNDDLLDGAFDGLQSRFDAWVGATQAQGRRLVREQYGEYDEAPVEAEQRDHRNEAWALFATLLVGIAVERLYTPAVEAPAHGEFDSTMLVPPGPVREVLQAAGGGPAATATGDAPSSGVLSGQTMADLLRVVAGAEFGAGYVWLYGDASSRTVPFPEHEALDGIEFASWDDDALASTSDWPDTDYYYPGDHDSCQCEAARLLVPAPEPAQESPVAVAAGATLDPTEQHTSGGEPDAQA